MNIPIDIFIIKALLTKYTKEKETKLNTLTSPFWFEIIELPIKSSVKLNSTIRAVTAAEATEATE